MNKWVRLAVLIAALNVTSPSLLACDCSEVRVKTTKKARQNWFNAFDGALFIGTVESVEPVAVIAAPSWEDEGRTVAKVVFKVERFWKGVQGSVVTVYTTVGCCGCLPHYAIGKRYFVTAFNKGNQLETRMCTVEEPGAAKSYEKDFGKGNLPRPVQTP